MGWVKIIIESDAFLAIQAIDRFHSCLLDPVIDYIRSLISIIEYVTFEHCFRSDNQVTHELARRSVHSRHEFAFLSEIFCISNRL